MAPYDYSEAPPPRDSYEMIPDGTVAEVQLHIRPGNAGEDGMCKRSKDGNCEMLDCEFDVVSGPYAKRKFWVNFVLAGTTSGHAQAADISRGHLRGILESARGIQPGDTSAQARAGRTATLKDFDGLVFIARIGIEKGKLKNDGSGESWADKNTLSTAVTPDKKDWHVVKPTPSSNGGQAVSSSSSSATPAPGITKPAWANG
jgi:hypothetical protein